MARRFEELQRLCKLYGYDLIRDPAACERPDILGKAGLQDEVQLCRGRVIAAGPEVDMECLVYGVSHELAHGVVGFCDEKDVLYEQANILARWVNELTKEKKDGKE